MSEIYTVNASGIYLKMLLFGDPGSGKTTLAASAEDHPDMRDVVVANVEGGMLSVAHRGDIKARDISSTADVEDFFWRIVKEKQSGKGEYGQIKTVIIDNATELQAMNLQEIVDAAIVDGRDPKKGDRDDIWREDYGKSTVQLKRIFRWFRMLPVNFIVTTHVKYVYPRGPKGEKAPNAEPIAIIPSLTEQLSRAVMGYVDFVWYLWYDSGNDGEDDEPKTAPTFNILTRPEGIHFAKTRGPNFAKALGKTRVIPEKNAMAEIYDLYLETTSPEYQQPQPPIKKVRKRA